MLDLGVDLDLVVQGSECGRAWRDQVQGGIMSFSLKLLGSTPSVVFTKHCRGPADASEAIVVSTGASWSGKDQDAQW